MPRLYAAEDDILEWTWLLYCASVKKDILLKGKAGAAAEYTWHHSAELMYSSRIRKPDLLLPGLEQGDNLLLFASSLQSFRDALPLLRDRSHKPLKYMPVFCWGTICSNTCIHCNGIYRSDRNGGVWCWESRRVIDSCCSKVGLAKVVAAESLPGLTQNEGYPKSLNAPCTRILIML